MKKPIEVMLFLNKYRKECKIHMESQKSRDIKAILRSENTAESFTILDLKLY